MSDLSKVNWKEVIGGQTAEQFMELAKASTIEEAALAHCRRLGDNLRLFFDKDTTKELAAWGLADYLIKELDNEEVGFIPYVNSKA